MTTEDRTIDVGSYSAAPPREGMPQCVLKYLSFDDRCASWHDADVCPGDDRDVTLPATRYTVRAGVGVPMPVPNHPYSVGLWLLLRVDTDDLEEAKAAWARAECYVNYAEPHEGEKVDANAGRRRCRRPSR